MSRDGECRRCQGQQHVLWMSPRLATESEMMHQQKVNEEKEVWQLAMAGQALQLAKFNRKVPHNLASVAEINGPLP